MKLMIKTISLFLFSLIITASAGFSGEPNIRVVYTEWFPYTYQENGEARGFEIDSFKAVMKNMNIEVEFVQYPWKRCLENLKNGKADALISMLKTPEREEFTFFPNENISISRTVFFAKADKDIKYSGLLEELKAYSIGYIMGFSYGEAFDKADYLKKDDAVDAQELITKLLHGRNDVAAENQAVISASAHKMGVKDKIRYLEPPIHTQKLYVGFSKAKDLKKLCDDFSKSLAEFKKSDSYKSILEKYGVKYSEMME